MIEHQVFDYTVLDSETRIVVQQRTSEIKECLRTAALTVWEIGQKLVAVRSRLEYGQFCDWLKAEFQWSRSTAYNYINVFETFGSCPNFGQLDIAISALYLLARPSTPEDVRQEALARASQGETITHALAKQIRFHHTIDVEAKTVENDGETSTLNQTPPDQEPLPPSEPVDEPLPFTTAAEIEAHVAADAEPQPTPEPSPVSRKLEDSAQTKLAPVSQFQVGDRVRILRRQHGKDNWAGKTARIWQITPDGWLRVDVEGHKGVRTYARTGAAIENLPLN